MLPPHHTPRPTAKSRWFIVFVPYLIKQLTFQTDDCGEISASNAGTMRCVAASNWARSRNSGKSGETFVVCRKLHHFGSTAGIG